MNNGITVTSMSSVYDSEIIWIEKIKDAQKPKYLVGDIDYSGDITIIDVTQIQRHVAHLSDFDEVDKLVSDVDANGMVNIIDATIVQRHVAHFVTEGSLCGEYIESDLVKSSVPPSELPTVVPSEYETQAPDENYTNIYFENSDNWSIVYSYYWSDSNTGFTVWPGLQMNLVSDNIYHIKVPKEATKIIFNNNSGIQTGDLIIPGKDSLYSDGEWYGKQKKTHLLFEQMGLFLLWN